MANDFEPWVSRTEEAMFRTLTAHCLGDWRAQVEIRTRFSNLWLDSLCTLPSGRRIGIECDGPGFHDDPLRDFCRDSLATHFGKVSAIYRVQAWAIHQRPCEWMLAVALGEPELVLASTLNDLKELVKAAAKRNGVPDFKRMIRRVRAEDEDVKALVRFAEGAHSVYLPQLVRLASASKEFGR